MAEFPKQAKVVIIGAGGIVGASIAHHLIERGWDDIVAIDKSGIPTDIGSTAHASDFCYTTSHDYLSVWTTQYSIDFFEKMGHYARIGGLEIVRAGDETWMEEVKRKISSGKAFGTRVSFIGPEEVKEKFPLVEEEMVAGALERLGGLGILVNNAGIRARKFIGDFTLEDFDRIVAINLRAPFFAAQAALPVMHGRGGGRIIFIASQLGVVTARRTALYGMTKAGLISLTRSMALELAEEGIRVNAISPARVHTPFVDRFIADNYPGEEDAMFENLAATQPIGRMGEPAEIAGLAVWLCSDEASFVTGSNHLIDGGFTGVRR